MNKNEKFVITINRELGSGGRTVGRILAEKLGGGGHQTVAGAQLYDTNMEQARDLLLVAIKEAIGNEGESHK